MSAAESTAVARRQNQPPSALMSNADAYKLGEVLAQSGYFSDVRSAAQATVKVLTGQELGIAPIAAMTGVHIIEGKPSMGANLLAGLVKRSKTYRYKILEHTDEKCAIEFSEKVGKKWELAGVSEFTIADARRAGLAHRNNWKHHPKNMLFARALSNGVRFYSPDVTGGAPVYTEEEAREFETPTVDVPPAGPNGAESLNGEVVDQGTDESPPSDHDPPPAEAESPAPTTRPITVNQRKLLFTYMNGRARTDPQYNADPPLTDEVQQKALMEWTTGTAHSDRIPAEKFDALREAIADWEIRLADILDAAKEPAHPEHACARKIAEKYLPNESGGEQAAQGRLDDATR